ncbi:MAG: peptidoglycan bridge formation glycyltransferase FemA/FemB family protein [Chloroflexota bacterium]|nr:peptidoglycan bridge formation glycyltransferase FemA/FemB family protein [Chloroflexota bacterium]MDE2930101.1 peptidoglycan bridge formation glycyltransferase FemA/FemB family protein [Chloroflexota bacterium]
MRKGEVAASLTKSASSAATDLVFATAQDHREWDALVGSWGGEVLQSWAWGEFKSRTGWYPERVLCTRDGQPVAAVQWLRRRVPLLGCLAYIPRGPVVAPKEASVAESVVRHVAEEARRTGAFALWAEPPWEAEHGPRLPAAFVATPDYIQPPATGLVDLRPPSEAVLAGFQSSMRRNIRLAFRRGLEVRVGRTEADWQGFYALLTETAERDGFGIHTWPYFATMRETLGASGVATLFLAEHAGKPLGGLLLTAYGGTATYLFGASATAGRDLRVGHGLQWHAMCWAKEHGCHTYDLWGMPADTSPTDPLAGVHRFKRGFSPRTVSYAPTTVAALDPRRFWVWSKLTPLARKLIPGF